VGFGGSPGVAPASCDAICFLPGLVFAGIRVLPSPFTRRRSVFWPFRWHPRIAFVLQASPLCGAAPTFLCRRKEK
jgi:hypothetical protein